MKLLNVQMHNFKSYREQSFDVPEAGLYFFTGENQADPKATTNGIGKSTLMDAIFWCLYGVAATGEKAGELLNEGPGTKGGYGVKLTFDTCVIERTWKPNTFKIDGADSADDDLYKVLPLTQEQFTRSVYFAQESDYFLDMTPGKKLEFLSNIFKLDSWVKASEIAKQEAASKQAELLLVESNISNVTQQITGLKDNESDLASKAQAWSAEVDKEIASLNQSISELEAKLTQLPDGSEYVTKQNALLAEIQELDKLERELTQEEQGYKIEIGIAENKIKELNSSLDQWLDPTSTDEPVCDNCGQVVTMEHLEKTSEDVTVRIAEQSAIILTITEALNGALLSKETDIEAPRTAKRGELSLISVEIEEIRKEAEIQRRITQDIESLQRQVTSKKNTSNPLTGVIESNKKQIETLEINLNMLQAKVAKLNHELVLDQHWEKHFKLLRLWILDDVIEQLEDSFNSALCELGFDEWEIKLDTERDLKTKNDVKKELVVKIYRNSVEKSYKGRSGGEKTRLKLSSTFGLSDLILNTESCDLNIRIYDEPGTGLSEEGVSDFLVALSHLGKTRTVLLADHRIIEKSHFTKVYRIIKDVNEISSISNA